jgi:hypothetical protein
MLFSSVPQMWASSKLCGSVTNRSETSVRAHSKDKLHMAVPEASTGIACPFDQRQLERAFSPLFQKSVPLRVCDVLFGNINTIIKVEGSGQTYGLRVRTQETVYRYEPDLIKEGFVSWLLSNRRNTTDDTAIATAFAKMRSSQRGIISDHSGILNPRVSITQTVSAQVVRSQSARPLGSDTGQRSLRSSGAPCGRSCPQGSGGDGESS